MKILLRNTFRDMQYAILATFHFSQMIFFATFFMIAVKKVNKRFFSLILNMHSLKCKTTSYKQAVLIAMFTLITVYKGYHDFPLRIHS